MKKIVRKCFCAVFAAVFILSLCACSPTPGGETPVENTTASVTHTEPRTDSAGEVRADANAGVGTPRELEVGDPAPDFEVSLVGGGTFRLSDHDDGAVLLNFWATWCGPCVGEMPAFERLANEGINGLAVICVNLSEDAGTVDAFVADNGYSFDIAYDESGVVGNYYPTAYIPYTLLINKGRIAEIFIGADEADIQYEMYLGAIGNLS